MNEGNAHYEQVGVEMALDSGEQALLHICWVSHQTGWNHKAAGKGSSEKDCWVFYHEHMKQPNYQMCFKRKF